MVIVSDLEYVKAVASLRIIAELSPGNQKKIRQMVEILIYMKYQIEPRVCVIYLNVCYLYHEPRWRKKK